MRRGGGHTMAITRKHARMHPEAAHQARQTSEHRRAGDAATLHYADTLVMKEAALLIGIFGLCSAINDEFPGYVHIPNWNSSLTDQPTHLDLSECPSDCISLSKDMCISSPVCDTTNSGGSANFPVLQRTFVRDSAFDMYLASNKSIVPQSACTLEAGGMYFPNEKWLKCSFDVFWYSDQMLNHFQLPPSLIADTCTKDPRCLAFRVNNDRSSGTTFGQGSCTTSGLFHLA